MIRTSKLGIILFLFVSLPAYAGASLEDIENSLDSDTVKNEPIDDVQIEKTRVVRPSVLVVRDSDANNTGSDTTYQFYSSDKAAEISYIKARPVLGLNNDRAVVSFLLNEERDNAVTAAIMFDVAPVLLTGLELSFGPKLIAGLLSIENADVIGFAASVEAAYSVPINKFPARLSTGFSYAPDVLTFGQSDRIIDWFVRFGLPLTKNIEAFVGARYLQFDTRPGERKLDQQIHLGVRWSSKR